MSIDKDVESLKELTRGHLLDLRHECIVRNLTGRGPEIICTRNMANRTSEEAQEVFNIVKKGILEELSSNRTNVLEKLGDLEFYIQSLREGLQITRTETLQASLKKFEERYMSIAFPETPTQTEENEGTV